VASLLWVRKGAAEVSETASTNMQFRCQNSNQREAGPLSPPETSEELGSSMLQGWLYAINGRNWH
jgi:hypothetical protein